jgi:hypothetical protein
MPSLKQIIDDKSNQILDLMHPEFTDTTRMKNRFGTPESMSFVNHKFNRTPEGETYDREDCPWKLMSESGLFDRVSGNAPINYGSFVTTEELDPIYTTALDEAHALSQWYEESEINSVPNKIMSKVTSTLNKFIKHWGQMAVHRLAVERRVLAVFENVKDYGWGFIAYFNCDEMNEPNEVIVASELHMAGYLAGMAKKIHSPIMKHHIRCQAISRCIADNQDLFTVLKPHLLPEFTKLESAVRIVTSERALPPGDLTEETEETEQTNAPLAADLRPGEAPDEDAEDLPENDQQDQTGYVGEVEDQDEETEAETEEEPDEDGF